MLRVLFQAPAVLAACLVGLALGKRAAALVDKVSPPLEVLVALALFAAQAAFSRLWLRGHRDGPVEWFLRALTYGRLPPKQVQPI
ncbi:DUF418 domain-containing protein [Nonomuraea africana]|uniref:DUF418 domain-containing protein n=1 Tax=Nonomuraea africana TaxID=46171 RepID=UPI0033D9A5D3